MKQYFPLYFLVLSILLIFLPGCDKFLEVPSPSYQVGSEQVFTNDGTATAAVSGIYSEMMANPSQFTTGQLTLLTGLYSDELLHFGTSDKDEFIDSRLTEARHSTLSAHFWAPAYRYIYTANLSLEKLGKSSTLSNTVRQQLTGELKFIRAFCYLQLVNLFGDVPLVLTSDHSITARIPRSPIASIYNQIVADLIDAKQLLTTTYAAPSTEKIRVNRWAAVALLARVYLYQKNWAAADAEATAVISSGAYQLVQTINQVFLKNSGEAIWQLQPVVPGWNTWEGRDILPATNASAPTYLVRPELISAFENGDLRRNAWIATRTFSGQQINYPYKYKVYGNNAPVTEYYTVLRLAEMYLIRSEARAQLNNIAGAIADINIIRSRAGLASVSFADTATLLAAVEQERRIELMVEWGHRWFDLKRTGKANGLLSILKPATWSPAYLLWPIPNNQISANPALVQNPGY